MGTTPIEIIRVDGTREEHQVGRQIATDFASRMIGADTLDGVNLRDGRYMYVDDAGHEKQLPVNPEATKLYHGVCRPGVTHQIRGDVAIVIDEDLA